MAMSKVSLNGSRFSQLQSFFLLMQLADFTSLRRMPAAHIVSSKLGRRDMQLFSAPHEVKN